MSTDNKYANQDTFTEENMKIDIGVPVKWSNIYVWCTINP